MTQEERLKKSLQMVKKGKRFAKHLPSDCPLLAVDPDYLFMFGKYHTFKLPAEIVDHLLEKLDKIGVKK